MSMETSVTVRFRTEGSERVRKALAGIVGEGSGNARRAIRESEATARTQARDAERAAKAKAKAARDAQKAQERAAREAQKVEERAAKEGARAHVRATRDAEREQERATKKAVREQERAANEKMRAEQRAARESARAWAQSGSGSGGGRRGRRGGGGGGGGQRQGGGDGGIDIGMPGFVAPAAAIGATLQYGGERVSRAGQWRGVDDVDSIMGQYTAQDRQLQIAAGVGERDVGELRALVRRGQTQHGIFGADTADALATLQDQFPEQVQAFVDNYDTLAELGSMFDAGLTGIGKVGALSVGAFGLSNDQMDDAALTLVGSTGKGSVNTSQLSQYYGAVPGLIRSAWGDQVQGMEGVRTFATIAQLSQKSGGTDAAEWSTSSQRFLSEIASPDVQARARRAGLNLTTGSGANQRLRSPTEVLHELSTNERLNRPGVIDDIFQSVESQRFVRGMRRGDVGARFVDDIMASSPEMGEALLANQQRVQQGTGAYQARMDATRREATVQSGAEERLARARRETGYIEDWEAANMDLPTPVRGLMTSLAGAAEGAGSWLDSTLGNGATGSWVERNARFRTEEQRGTLGAGLGDYLADPRILFRSLLGGDAGAVSAEFRGNGVPMLGRSQGEALAPDISEIVARTVAQATVVATRGSNPFAEGGAERVVAATNDSTRRIETALNNNATAIRQLGERLPNVGRDDGGG